ncbi:MAG TPA: deoxyribose-phosphate aldolase [Candidatus Limnocylindrales bacterium]|jgi:deoxyribose-phosphate aldolase|nr:deoxyribose-phosphate aldolase [Candidatus Limnocylindrales bacterium]
MSQTLTDSLQQVRGWQALAAEIDHTILKPDTTREQIVRLCEEAAFFNFASVCISPWWISVARSILSGTPVKVATTIGFPHGVNHTTVKRFEAEEAIRMGAQELDMVQNVGALRSGDRMSVQNDIASVVEVAHASGAIVKVILETPLLTLEEKIVSCQICLAAHADFVKTATGFNGGATSDDVTLMRGVVGRHAGVKASGGIRTAATAQQMIDAGANRIGTSSGVAIMHELGAPEFHPRG